MKLPEALFQACTLTGFIYHPGVNQGEPLPIFSATGRTYPIASEQHPENQQEAHQ